MNRKLIRIFMLLTVIGIITPLAVTYSLPGQKKWVAVWNANTEADLLGYKLYYKKLETDSFTDAKSIDVGKVTQFELPTIVQGNYLALTAYSATAESGFSNTIFFAVPPAAPLAPVAFKIQ